MRGGAPRRSLPAAGGGVQGATRYHYDFEQLRKITYHYDFEPDIFRSVRYHEVFENIRFEK
jgi:hypothetical protein